MNRHDVFVAENAFFVIDSDNLDKVSSVLYGYTIIDNVVVEDVSRIGGATPEGDGAYVYIRRSGNEITIYQDFIGSYGLYIYRSGDYFALSNSFLTLVDHVKKTRPLSLNLEFADYVLAVGLCSATFSETMINEISLLDRSAIVHVDVARKELNIEYIDYRENTVELSSEEGMSILDNWYSKWSGILTNIYAKGGQIQMDLSGGFDSRMILNIMCGSGAKLDNIFVNSINDNLHTHTEDFQIASEISQQYGFTLNDRHGKIPASVNYTIDDSLNISFGLKLCFHKQMYPRVRCYTDSVHYFGGSGGECVRNYWNKTEEEYIKGEINRCKRFHNGIAERIAWSTEEVLRRTFESMRAKYSLFGREIPSTEISRFLYRETRCRSHFGKDIIENYYGGAIKYAPLLDRELHRLKLSDAHCGDRDLLMAIMFDRYNSKLLDFRFDSQRVISPQTIEYAREINRRFPACVSAHVAEVGEISHGKRGWLTATKDNPPLPQDEIRSAVRDIFYSERTQNTFALIYDQETYEKLCAEIESKQYQPLENAYAVLGIARILQDVLISENLHSSNIAQSFNSRVVFRDVREMPKENESLSSATNEQKSISDSEVHVIFYRAYRFLRRCAGKVIRVLSGMKDKPQH